MSDLPQGPRRIEAAPPPDEDALARLLRAAGHRPPVPGDDAEIIRTAALFEWRRKVKARARRSRYLRAGGLLAAAALVLLVVGPPIWKTHRPGVEEAIARLEAVTGQVRVVSAAGEEEAATAAELAPGDVVETGPAGGSVPGRAALRLAGGPSVRLDSATRLRLLSESVLALDRGAVYVDSGPHGTAERFEIRTSLGTARDVGTQFEVRLATGTGVETLALRVREGLVVLARGDESHPAAAGVELTVRPDGTVAEGTVPLRGPVWDWTLAIAPAFAIDGRTPRELLEWVARERGWELEFADREVADGASTTTLSGGSFAISVLDEETLATLLTGSGLGFRVEDGTIRVALAPPPR